MKVHYTTQDVVDMGADLYDNHGFTREAISKFLKALLDNGLAEFNYERVFDLIVG